MTSADPFSLPLESIPEENQLLVGAIRTWANKDVIPVRRQIDEDWDPHELCRPLLDKLCVEHGYQWAAWPSAYRRGRDERRRLSHVPRGDVTRGLRSGDRCELLGVGRLANRRAVREPQADGALRTLVPADRRLVRRLGGDQRRSQRLRRGEHRRHPGAPHRHQGEARRRRVGDQRAGPPTPAALPTCSPCSVPPIRPPATRASRSSTCRRTRPA